MPYQAYRGGGRPARRRGRRARGHKKWALRPLLLVVAVAVMAVMALAAGLAALDAGRGAAPEGGGPDAAPPAGAQAPEGGASLPPGAAAFGGVAAASVAAASGAGPAQSAPPLNADDWRLVLVNPWNSLPAGSAPALAQLKNGQAVDERCLDDLQAMMDACRAAGLDPLICSSYRTQEKQERLFEGKVAEFTARGYGAAAAEAEAAKIVAVPGTSEHQLGLAVDIVAESYQLLDATQEGTAVQQWLMENSWQYGFVLRYPGDKSEVTGIIYEPWHYRYVGREHAEAMATQGLCLEEYLNIKPPSAG